MAGRPVKALPEVPEGLLSPQQAEVYRQVKEGRTVREAAALLGIPAKQASKQLAAVRRKAGSFPPSGVTPGAADTPVPRYNWQEEALALIEGRGLSPGEAARRLGVRPGAVRSVLWRRRRNTGGAGGAKTACYRLGEDGYLPPATHPGTGFGLRLRNCRRRAGLALDQLAALGGMAVCLLERLEKGEYLPDWALAHRLCDVLGVELDDLVAPCGRVELTRELVLRPGLDEAGRSRAGRGTAIRRLAVAGGARLTLPGPEGRMVVHGKGGRFVVHLDRESRSRVKRVLADRRLRLLELTGDGGALYLTGAADVAALREEFGLRSDNGPHGRKPASGRGVWSGAGEGDDCGG